MKPPHPKPKAIFTVDVGALGGSVRVFSCKIQTKQKIKANKQKL